MENISLLTDLDYHGLNFRKVCEFCGILQPSLCKQLKGLLLPKLKKLKWLIHSDCTLTEFNILGFRKISHQECWSGNMWIKERTDSSEN